MIKVKTSNDIRAHIQNGFWGFKLLLLLGLIIGSFYIPGDRNQTHEHQHFDLVLMFIGSVGGLLVKNRDRFDYMSFSFLCFSLY